MKREAVAKNSHLGKRAIVVGAGLGGLSAARVLSDYFDEVMILDRDELPGDAIPRPGAPQRIARRVLFPNPKDDELELAEVALRVGFSDQSKFSFHFKRLIGVTPRQFRLSAKIV
jgi:AraC-like DNA-binding protein